jgi:DNA-binding HxlR family transcriptional regulator
MEYRDLEHELCSIARPISVLGERWTLIVLRQAFMGARRFEGFQSSLGISRSLLADRLSRLVAAGILERRPYSSGQRTREEYRLTQKGRDLWPVLMALRAWGDRYMAPDGPFVVYRHRGCDGVVDVEYACDGCGQRRLSVHDVVPEAGPGKRAASASG